MSNMNPVTIYFTTLEEASDFADKHPEIVLTIWGKTQSGSKYRGSFVLRKKYEEQNAEQLPTV